MADRFIFQQPPDLRIVDFPQTIMRTPHSSHRPWERPTCGVKQGQRPKVMASVRLRVMGVETALNNIAHSGQICTPVSIHHTLGLRGGTRRVRKGNHTLLIYTLGLECIPPVPTSLAIKRQPLIHSLIERSTRRTLRCLSIRVHNHRNRGMALAEAA